MCGIAGFFELNTKSTEESIKIVQKMADTLIHRGPNGSGVWSDNENGVFLSHRRLSIFDLSEKAAQPMASQSEKFIISYNGEIYNFRALRKELEDDNILFKTESDTEVILEAIEHWGLENALSKFNGMFAFALWDKQNKELTLVRDRIGIKPLYYGTINNRFFFSSELKSLKVHPEFSPEINRDALTLYLRYGFFPAPHSVYKNIFKLMPGSLLKINAENINLPFKPINYWQLKDYIKAPKYSNLTENKTQLETLLYDSIKSRMQADVPYGAFLSGGIDSSLIVSLMSEISTSPVKTFTIGFAEQAFNEATYAKEVANIFQTEHTELIVTPEEARNVIPKLPELYDEPFSDSSQIPTFLVSELTQKSVTISLSGDGADELFCGYGRYFWGNTIYNKTSRTPSFFKNIVSNSMTSISPSSWDILTKILPGKRKNMGDKIHKLARLLKSNNRGDIHQKLSSIWEIPENIVLNSKEPSSLIFQENNWPEDDNFIKNMMYLDTMVYLPDDLLVKVDRASMGVSLEARVPFLDHRLIEFVWGHPELVPTKQGENKAFLKSLLLKKLPQNLINRPKMGFAIPISDWLRGPLKEWAESLLNEERLKKEGYFDPKPIRLKWHEHLNGTRNWQHLLWNILMFQTWLEKNF